MKSFLTYLWMPILFFCVNNLFATEKSVDDTDLEFELKLLHEGYSDSYIQSASRIGQTTAAETPAIITIISEQEILNSGARDLIDVLRLVPGFDFGVDVQNIVGPAIRGNWAYEGNILLMIDGLEMNDRRYGTTQLGNHYPIDNIQKIEIIRGSGAITYGSFAKLGVINIITKTAKDQQGVSVIARYGQMQNSNGHRLLSLYGGKQFNEDTQFTVMGQASQAHRSDQIYHDVYGDTLDFSSYGQLENLFLNSSLNYKNLSLRFLVDRYRANTADGFVNIDKSINLTFDHYAFDLNYHYDFDQDLRLNFKFNYYHQTPWQSKQWIDNQIRYTNRLDSDRYLADSHLDYHYQDFFTLSIGSELTYETFNNRSGQYDLAHITLPDNSIPALPDYKTISAYLESLFKSKWGNLSIGLRYDYHNIFQPNFSTRVVFTDQIKNFNYKLLYNRSFRYPNSGIVLLNIDGILKPERTQSYEIELGYQFNPEWSFKANAFYITSKDRFVYGLDNANPEAVAYNLQEYYNSEAKINMAGVESELRWKGDWGYITLNHSYSQMLENAKKFQAFDFIQQKVVDSSKALGFPTHKISFNGHFAITPDFSINPSVIVSSSRYGYQKVDDSGSLILQKYNAEILGNLYFRYQNLFTKNLELGFGIYNLFNTHHQFIQPYSAGHAPLPDLSREFIIKIAYQL
ncbi:MAG: hypothetical protein RL637_1139 [Pseudomonadota bacterium]|jgi:outer membrane receptor for ferrienterochelin and colicin